MLATLVIGLREGLEAALIVGIIAAFLRNNDKSLIPMWIGVALAVTLSIAVGVGLALVEHALPQAAQEGLETVIGGIAVCFVTGMIVWMNNHARDMKRQLESEAAHALGRASTYALASMAFLAVLKEGFETSVFLLATFSVAQSASLAAAGAIVGLLIAVVIGWGIYRGGVKFNLSKFFRYTAAFLVLVAAGLIVASLRTAHEAGWLDAGQQVVLHLGWLVAPGTIQSSLITGVLGIPADPRLIEVLGWLAYLIPVGLYLYWPQARRPKPRNAAYIKAGIGVAGLSVALGLAVFYPQHRLQIPAQASLVSSNGGVTQPVGTATLTNAAPLSPATLEIRIADAAPVSLTLPAEQAKQQQRDGELASTWRVTRSNKLASAPSNLTLTQVVHLAGGRVPVGLNPRQHPGPYLADWTIYHATRVWLANGELLDASGRSLTTVTLTGGGLLSPRTLTPAVNPAGAGKWHVSPRYVSHVVGSLRAARIAHMERQFWAQQLPVFLAAIALLLLFFAWRGLVRLQVSQDTSPANSSSTTTWDRQLPDPDTKGAPDVA